MTKLSVVIADDDHLMLKNLHKLVNWDNLGFNIVATATNGKKALQNINKYHPQVLITDIIMPVMNGLELIEQVRNNYPEIKIVIISSYDEFEYAKKAIEKGVTDYILKTEVTSASFTTKLSSLYQDCLSQNHIISTVLNREFADFFDDNPLGSDKELIKEYPMLKRFLKNRYQFFIITQMIGFTRHIQSTLSYYQEASQFVYSSLQSMGEFSMAPILFSYKHFCILGMPIESDYSNQVFMVKSFVKKILLNLNRRADHSCMVFYSNSLITPTELLRFYQKNQNLLSFYASFDMIAALTFKEIEASPIEAVENDFSFMKLSLDKEHLESDIIEMKRYLTICCQSKNYPAIIQFFQNFCTHMEIVSNNVLQFEEQTFFPSIEYLLKWVFNNYEQCINSLLYNQTQNYNASVETAIRYMQQKYSNYTLSAEDISSQAALSPGRLGVLFKQDTGKTINEYLTDLRIKNAIYFLSNTSMKIYEISDKCGYKSSQYFSQIFYQKTGKKPIDYRKTNH
jgi:YesN/AraC family two-component response regulator